MIQCISLYICEKPAAEEMFNSHNNDDLCGEKGELGYAVTKCRK